ncbi:MAG: hypothetical protein N2110_02940 [Flavobacteriales bacterium]|nr:hypothetical protein [Flavobacteriales bacterium]MCX7767962.1 hypothetical protein [Flavobacteriales bacterium]MDW8409168.1 hypothetical protein [Flavobacteriales bacterium]
MAAVLKALSLCVLLIALLSGAWGQPAPTHLNLDGCARCPGPLWVEFPAEYLMFSLDSAQACRDKQSLAWTSLREPLPVRLRCGGVYRTLWLETAHRYRISFAGLDSGFLLLEKGPLQGAIEKILSAFDSLYLHNTAEILSGKGKALAQRLASTLDSTLGHIPGAREYLIYTLAQFHLATESLPRSVLYNKYLKNQPIQWKNEAYGAFFRDFYEDFLVQAVARRSFEPLAAWLKTGGSFQAVDSVIRNMPFLEDSVLRYPAFILALVKLSQHKDFRNAPLHFYLGPLSQKLPTSREARSFLQAASKALYRPDAADYENLLTLRLREPSGGLTSLSALANNRPLLAVFCDPYSKADMSKIPLLQTLEKNLKGRLRVAIVLLGPNPSLTGSSIPNPPGVYYEVEDPVSLKPFMKGRTFTMLLYDAALRFLSADLPPPEGPIEEFLRSRLNIR